MARVQYGGGVAEMRGKWSGQVHTRNKGGASIRVKVTPINPSTTTQTQARTRLATLASTWRDTLTEAQRLAWNAFGAAAGTIGIFGDRRNLSGIAAYQKVNNLVLMTGNTRIDDPPVPGTLPTLSSISVATAAGAATMSCTFAPTDAVTTAIGIISATPGMSPGITNFKNKLRYIWNLDLGTSPVSIKVGWTNRFGSLPPAGQKIGFSVLILDPTTGQFSPPQFFTSIVAA